MPKTQHRSRAARFGLTVKRHPARVAFIQWSMVALYFFLLFAPIVLALAPQDFTVTKDLHLLSLFVFWGFGWPLILLATMLFGRIWCGFLCPDGTLTEIISRHGQKRSIPRWIRWPGWPCLTLAAYILLFFCSDASRHHPATVLLLGSLTLGAALTGFLYGKGRRIWCMYLCPTNAVFTFLARLSPFHFRVDPEKWDTYQGPHERINCAPLINIKQMKSTSACHACARCSGYRDAVELATRSPAHEILSDAPGKTRTLSAVTFLFVVTGMGTAVFLPDRFFAPASANGIPAFLLWTLGSGLLLGSFLWVMIWLSYHIAASAISSWQQLSLGIIPLTGTGLFLGATMFSLDFLQPGKGIMPAIQTLQQILLAAAWLSSLWLGWKSIVPKVTPRYLAALLLYTVAASVLAAIWGLSLWP
ncbi:4Fe-4S binding protein [Oxalobacter sp. OttesenSCG-928-P03]|nr:4Fe-4S binding protein [Oxalobacter sp. OttesenSCG-928-P03]